MLVWLGSKCFSLQALLNQFKECHICLLFVSIIIRHKESIAGSIFLKNNKNFWNKKVRSRSYAPKNVARSCCDTVHFPAGYDDQAYIFTKSMPAGKTIKLCRKSILPQISSKIKSMIDFLYYNPIQQGNNLYYRHTVANKTQETSKTLPIGKALIERDLYIS